MLVLDTKLVFRWLKRLQDNAFALRVTFTCDLCYACRNAFFKLRRWEDAIYQAPLHGALAFHTFCESDKDVGKVSTYETLIYQASQSTRAWEYAEVWDFRKRNGRTTIDGLS